MDPPTLKLAPFEVRVHLLQGRELPARDDNGLLDPYVMMTLGDQAESSSVLYETRDPIWYETKRLKAWLPKNKEDHRLAPDVVLGVWDRDLGAKDDFVGTVRLRMEDAWKAMDDDVKGLRLNNKVTEENWRRLQDRGLQGGGGQLLVVHQLIPIEGQVITQMTIHCRSYPSWSCAN